MLRKPQLVRFLSALVLALLLALGVQASMEPMDDRTEAEIGIVRPEGDAAEPVEAAVVSLRERLVAERFRVVLVERPVADPRGFLEEGREVVHLITALRVGGEEGEVGTTLYTRGAPTPERFEPAPVETLVARVRAFLISRRAVDLRLAAAGESDDPYQRALREGLRLMEERESAPAAVAAFEKAAELRPDEPVPHLNLALTYKRLGQQVLRRRHVEAGLDLDPANPALRNEKALLHIMDGDLQAAAVVLEDLPQDDPVVLWNLAYVYGQMQQMDRAKTYFRKVAELEADRELSVVARGRFEELERKEERLGAVSKGLWVALAGLGGVLAVALIVLIARRLGRHTRDAEGLSPGDRLAVRVQVGLAIVSGLFSIVTVVLSNLLSGP